MSPQEIISPVPLLALLLGFLSGGAVPARAVPQQAARSGKSSRVLPSEKAAPIRVPRFDFAPTIDGKLDDEVWSHAVVLKDFVQIDPADNTAPSKLTEALLGYDSKALYIAFRCFDDPKNVRANIPKRDQIFDDDYVGLLLDTFNNHRRAYEFNFNPFGIQADGLWIEGQGEDFNLDVVMKSKGVITAQGWTVEAAIPFKSLRYPAGKDQVWGIHFWRRIKRFNNEMDMWMPIDRDVSSWLAQEGHLTGLKGISTSHKLDLIPGIAISETGERKATLSPAQIQSGLVDRGAFVNQPITLQPSLTGAYSLNPAITLDFALNPDFAQVEADQLVVRANQRFPIFYPEKRPFFLEGADIFQTQLTAVHTRTIVAPDFAAKVSGKADRNTFAMLIASDKNPGNPANFTEIEKQNAANQRLLGKKANVGVLRVKRDIGSQDSFIGFLVTSYNFVDRHNQLAGVDGRFRLNQQTTFSWQFLGTHTRESFPFSNKGNTSVQSKNGAAYALDLSRNGRHLSYEFLGAGRTRFFRSEVGFNDRTNTNNFNLTVRYSSEPKPAARLTSWQISDNASTNFDWRGRSQLLKNETQIMFNFRRQTSLGFGYDEGFERVFEQDFGRIRQVGDNCVLNNNCTFSGFDDERSANNRAVFFSIWSNPAKRFILSVLTRRAFGNLDYDLGSPPRFPRVSPSALASADASASGLCLPNPQEVLPPVCNAPLDPGPGSFFHADGNFSYQAAAPLNITLTFTKEWLRRYDTDRLAFDENLISLKTTYQFANSMFFRGRADFDSLASNIKGQLLFGWTPTPGTFIYGGYNDDLNTNRDPLSGQLKPGLIRNERTFFLKFSYLWSH